jgi:hypothetical protein
LKIKDSVGGYIQRENNYKYQKHSEPKKYPTINKNISKQPPPTPCKRKQSKEEELSLHQGLKP